MRIPRVNGTAWLLVTALLAYGSSTGVAMARARPAVASGYLPGPVTSPARTPGPVTPASTNIRVGEGQVDEVGPGGSLTYPGVTSCLTVTIRLQGGGMVGAHASLFQVPGEYRSDRILAAVKQRIGGRGVRAVEVRGAVGAWDPSYFAKAIESYPEGAQVPVPTEPDPDGLARVVADGLDVPRGKVTVEDLPDGDQTVR
ncbi:hypothetical protein ADK74_28120 [Streptomyces decoyicus]|uniref:hypothetical protein n=2 Tax=Streptomyces decoyicus TaxID=249567 RepID=UPI000662B97C|nr:hypothetical protein [Streptomyces decoyicus]KOG39606.1 hypothetical protein ADK74_28120 [Streptomyces decoyicus]QZY14215.1 hypothetical protein K7C20_02340 [Streptomyces decoyicus]